MKSSWKYVMAWVLPVIVGLGCSNGETDTRSMEQIYAEDGVPVRVEQMAPAPFIQELAYTAELTGVEESSAFAMVSDRIEHITAHVGDVVEKDSVIVSFPTDNPTANYYQAKVQYENAAATFERTKQYFAAGGLSRQAFENAEASFRVAEANWDAVSQSVLVRAPISGVITRLNVRESDNVNKDDELFTVSRTDRLKAHVWVPDTEIHQIAVGNTARAVWETTELSGRIVQVDRSVNKQRQAFGVIVELDNQDVRLRSGVTATVYLEAYHSDAVLSTLRKNVSRDREGYYVFVAEGDRAVKRYVSLGHSQMLSVEIADGLATGDSLITEGQLHLKDGSRITILIPKATSTDVEAGS